MKNKGGVLVGASHKEGGIDIVTPNGKIEAEGGEIVITKKASEEHCEELSRINQDGGGVKIPCDAQKTGNKGRFDDGGKITDSKKEAVINYLLSLSTPDFMDVIHYNTDYDTSRYVLENINTDSEISKSYVYWFVDLLDTYNDLDTFIHNVNHPKGTFKKISFNVGGKINQSDLEIGIKDEEHHRKTLTDLSAGKITVDQAIVETAKDHLKEDPDFYKDQNSIKNENIMENGNIINDGDIVTWTNRAGDFSVVSHIGDDYTIKAIGYLHADYKGSYNAKISELTLVQKAKEGAKIEVSPTPSEVAQAKTEASPINAGQVTLWDKVPSSWKNTKTVNEVKFINSPYDKGLLNIFKPFFGADELRPHLNDINFDENGITATDAHKLLTIPYPNTKYKGVYLTGPMGTKGAGDQVKKDLFLGKYPNYPAIMPKSSDHQKFEFSIYKLLQYTQVAQKYCNQATWHVSYKFGEQVIGFNSKFLIEVLTSALKLGHETLYAFVRKPNDPLILSPDTTFTLGKSEIYLLMPVMLTTSSDEAPFLGSADLDFGRELKCYFDFADNNIHNADGSVADFKMNYGEYSVISPDAVHLLEHYVKRNHSIAILEYFAVLNGKIIADDMGTQTVINIGNSPLQNGLYRAVDGAIEFDAFGDVDDYPAEREPVKADYGFVISAGIFKYYIDKALDFVGNDDLRPTFNGVNITHTAGKTFIYATNAHILFKADITRYVEINKNQIDFSIMLDKTNLMAYLDFVGEDALVLKANKQVTIISCSKGSFYTRNIDGKYPSYDQVIPQKNTNAITINIKDLYNCLKNPEAIKFLKEHKKNAPIIFDLPSNAGQLDIYLGAHGYKDEVIGAGQKYDLIHKLKICTVAFKASNDPEKSDSLLLIMPILKTYHDVNNFAFNIGSFQTILDTCSSEEITFNYTAINKAYTVNGDCFSFGQTVSARKQPKPSPLTPQQEWQNAINTLKQDGGPDSVEAIETIEMLLKHKFEGGGQVSIDERAENASIQFEPVQTPLY